MPNPQCVIFGHDWEAYDDGPRRYGVWRLWRRECKRCGKRERGREFITHDDWLGDTHTLYWRSK